jgi:hypothetical protein
MLQIMLHYTRYLNLLLKAAYKRGRLIPQIVTHTPMVMSAAEDTLLLRALTVTSSTNLAGAYTPWTGVLKVFEYGLSHEMKSLRISLPGIQQRLGGHWYQILR